MNSSALHHVVANLKRVALTGDERAAMRSALQHAQLQTDLSAVSMQSVEKAMLRSELASYSRQYTRQDREPVTFSVFRFLKQFTFYQLPVAAVVIVLLQSTMDAHSGLFSLFTATPKEPVVQEPALTNSFNALVEEETLGEQFLDESFLDDIDGTSPRVTQTPTPVVAPTSIQQPVPQRTTQPAVSDTSPQESAKTPVQQTQQSEKSVTASETSDAPLPTSTPKEKTVIKHVPVETIYYKGKLILAPEEIQKKEKTTSGMSVRVQKEEQEKVKVASPSAFGVSSSGNAPQQAVEPATTAIEETAPIVSDDYQQTISVPESPSTIVEASPPTDEEDCVEKIDLDGEPIPCNQEEYEEPPKTTNDTEVAAPLEEEEGNE